MEHLKGRAAAPCGAVAVDVCLLQSTRWTPLRVNPTVNCGLEGDDGVSLKAHKSSQTRQAGGDVDIRGGHTCVAAGGVLQIYERKPALKNIFL